MNVLRRTGLPVFMLTVALSAWAVTPTAVRVADLPSPRAGSEESDLFAVLNGRIVAMTENALALDDGTGSIWIYSDDRTVSAGDRVEVWCTVWRNRRNGGILAGDVRRMTVLERGDAPSPVAATVADIVAGRHLLRVAQTRGVVTDVLREEVDPNWIDFVIETDSQRLIAVLYDRNALPLERFSSLIDREVSVTGVVKPPPVASYPSADIEPSLYLRTSDDIAPVGSPSIAPGAHPHRQSFSGTVVSPCGANAFFLATEDGPHVRVKTMAGEPHVTAGQSVTVAGFVRRNRYMFWLENAVVGECRSQPAGLPRPRSVSARSIIANLESQRFLNVGYQGALIALTGKITDVVRTADSERIAYLEDAGIRIPVHLGDIPPPPVGSEVEIGGGCLVVPETDENPLRFCKPRGIELFPRDGRDVVVRRNPPWWTPLRLGLVILGLVLALVVLSVWSRLLRRVINRQSQQLLRTRLAKERQVLRTKERALLAVELHDSLSQNLTGVGLQLAAYARARHADPSAAERHVSTALSMLKSSRLELDRCIHDLRGHALDDPNFEHAIRQTLGALPDTVAVTLRFDIRRNDLDDRTAHAVLCIVRELVANALTHGLATRIRIVGENGTGALKFAVTDNGIGFDAETAPGVAEGHFGLAGIRERVKDLSGAVDIRPRKGRGTRIVVSIPFPNPSAGLTHNEENQNPHRR